jgi:hypothetical protein
LAAMVVRHHASRIDGGCMAVGGEWWTQTRPAVCTTTPTHDHDDHHHHHHPHPSILSPATATPTGSTTRTAVGFHWDKCERTRATTGEYRHPLRSTVTYLCATGGPTCVLEQRVHKEGGLELEREGRVRCMFLNRVLHSRRMPLEFAPFALLEACQSAAMRVTNSIPLG